MDHLHPTCSQGAGGSESIAAPLGPLPAARPQRFVFFREDLSLKGGKKKTPPKKTRKEKETTATSCLKLSLVMCYLPTRMQGEQRWGREISTCQVTLQL